MTRTLYEDWQLRRERLNYAESLPHFEEQARVFDYLLRRYKDDPIAQRPAYCPHSSQLVLNSRRIIVHHYRALREFGGKRSLPEIHENTRAILQRIAKPKSEDEGSASLSAPADSVQQTRLKKERMFTPEFIQLRDLLYPNVDITLNMTIAQTLSMEIAKDSLWSVMDLCYSHVKHGSIPVEAIDYLWQKAKNIDLQRVFKPINRRETNYSFDEWQAALVAPEAFDPEPEPIELRWREHIMTILENAHDMTVTARYCDAWVENKQSARFMERVENYLRAQPGAVDSIRDLLAHERTYCRARAALLLSEIGDLHDIGMLQDFLSLPELNHDQTEREAFLKAMKLLAEAKANQNVSANPL